MGGATVTREEIALKVRRLRHVGHGTRVALTPDEEAIVALADDLAEARALLQILAASRVNVYSDIGTLTRADVHAFLERTK